MSLPDDTHHIEKIREYLQEFSDNSLISSGKLTLGIKCSNEKEYTTTFKVSRIQNFNNKGKYLNIKNKCINISYNKDYRGSGETLIWANVERTPCFEPRLLSDATNVKNRITTTDVLQVLKTKMLIANPEFNSEPKSISLLDEAEIDDVLITPYRLLRGQMPLYWKYGYFNEEIPKIQRILSDLKGTDLKDIINTTNSKSFYEKIKDILKVKGETFKDTDSLISIITKIPFEYEEGLGNFSNKLLIEIMKQYKHIGFNKYDTYYMDLESPEWKGWSKKIVITNVEFKGVEVRMGGARRRTQRRRGSRRLKN